MSNKAKELENKIEELELDEMSEEEINDTVKAFSSEGVKLRADRKKIRYKLYRLRTESEGKCASDVDDDFKEIFENQDGFDSWRMFATTWDVSMTDPRKVVSRALSEQDEWDNVVRSKFPQIKPDGKIVYPDIQVKQKVDAESKKRGLK